MWMGWWGSALPTSDEWSALWAFGTMLATFGTVLVGLGTIVIAGVAAWVALRQLRAYIAEQEERARPYLVVDFWFKSSFTLYVTVENISSTPATDLTLTSTPMIQGTLRDRNEALARIFNGEFVVPLVAPGRVIRWRVDAAHALFDRKDLPHRFEVTATYSDPRARAVGTDQPRRYSDVFILDLDAFGQASGEENYDNQLWNIAVRNERRVQSIDRSLDTVASVLRESATKTREPLTLVRRRMRRR